MTLTNWTVVRPSGSSSESSASTLIWLVLALVGSDLFEASDACSSVSLLSNSSLGSSREALPSSPRPLSLAAARFLNSWFLSL